MKKYIIEVSAKGIKKTFVDGKNKYIEQWVRTESGSKTNGICLTEQLEGSGEYDDSDLMQLLEEDNLDGLWDYFEENPEEYESKGKFIKSLATCSSCKLDLSSKWERGIWGFGRIYRDENNRFYTKCPICESGEKHYIDAEDINFKPKGKKK